MESQVNTKNEIFQLYDLWAKYKHLWPWFLISIVVCCSVAVIYIKVTPKSYKRTASVLIKDDSGIPDVTAAFSLGGALSRNSNVKNEVEAFRSPQLVQDAIRRLDFMVNYYYKKKLNQVNLYANSPIKASFPDSKDEDFFLFTVEFKPDSSVILSKFERANKQKLDTPPVRGKFYEILQTPVGKVVISPTSFYGTHWCFIPLQVEKNDILSSTRSIVNKLKSSLSSKDNSIVLLEYIDTIIPRADDFLNALMDAYNDNWIFEKNRVANTTMTLLNERLPTAKEELEEIERNLERYKSQNLLTNVQTAASIYMAQSSDYSSRIGDVKTQITIANFIKDYLNINDINNPIPANSGLDNSAIERQIADYNTTLLERDILIANSSDKHPSVIEKNNTLATLRASIYQSMENHIATLNLRLSGFQSQEARITRNISSNPGLESRLATLEREYKLKETVYTFLLQKKEENEMALVTSATNTRVIHLPTGPKTPESPKSMLVMLVALFIGVGIPGSVVFGKEFLNITIRGEEDLESLSVPSLGVISLADTKDQKGGALLVKEKGTDMLNETFRTVRTNLDNMCTANDMKVIMFTSLEPGPGKTFTALNLAMTLALAGKRIALVDLDMRTATLSRMISNPAQGIHFYLSGIIPEERFIIEENYFYNGFDVIPVGEIPPNPTELLMTDRFKGLITRLKQSYDYVFLDCTPLDVVTDATIAGKHADLTVFVVREGYTSIRKIRELEKIHQKGQFKKMATILNGSKLEVTLNKHHTYFKEKANEVAKLPRAAYTPGKTKQLPEGSNKLIESGDH